MLENQAPYLEGREADLFSVLLRVRYCDKLNVRNFLLCYVRYRAGADDGNGPIGPGSYQYYSRCSYNSNRTCLWPDNYAREFA